MSDGGDIPFADADAGVYQVASAMQPDGGLLGEGWYLTGPRMQRVGEHIVELESRSCPEPVGNGSAFFIGTGVGAGVVLIAVLVLVLQGAGK